MKLIIDINDNEYEGIKKYPDNITSYPVTIHLYDAVRNGTPLDKHDEEIIAETVESIWGKPPYTELLEKLRAEIENHCGLLKENHCKYCSYCNSVMGVREILEIIDKYKAERSK